MAAAMTGAEPIAIVGLSLQVPGAGTVEEFWRNLVNGVESRTVFSLKEQAARGVPRSMLDDPAFVPVAPVLDRLEYFDPGLFGMTAREADLADPQQRLFLEHAHAALFDAGCDPARYDGEIGVYVGANADLYQWLNVRRNAQAVAAAGELSIGLANKPDYLASTVSYRLNLRGPSLAVRAGCSSSLVAVHLAAEALRGGECDAALAGGVCVELPHGVGYLAVDGYSSSDGHCRPFDAQADGTVWGSGIGVVLLKRLADALDDGDDVRALLIGNAVNNDGATKAGFTAPSVSGQIEVVVQALASAGIDPRTVGYVEAHGTGTALGDPVEIAALTAAYGQGHPGHGWCGVGSVKSNIGHLSHAGGVVGLIKTVLALQHELIPPTVNFERPNPEIDIAGSPFYVVSTLTKWEREGAGPRRAGVSSLGLGGTNAHVVLEEAPERAPVRDRHADAAHLIQVSAATPTALAASCTAIATHLTVHPELDLRDVAHTLQSGRPAYRHRAAVVAVDRASAASALNDRKRRLAGDAAAPPRVALLFSGQGSQHPGMGARLYAAEPAFAAAVDDCAAAAAHMDDCAAAAAHMDDCAAAAAHMDDCAVAARAELDLRELLFGTGQQAPARLADPVAAHLALFTVGYGLAALWRRWGVAPAAMIGHSVGEYAAATVAGVFELADALRVVAARGRLVASGPPAAALAVQRGEDEVAGWLPDGTWISVVNGPGTCTVTGAPERIAAFEEILRERGVGCTVLRAPNAAHSPLLDTARDELAAVVSSVSRQAPALPFWSTVTAAPISAGQAVDPAYWADHLCRPVRFGAAVAGLAAADPTGWVFLECGPGRRLAGLVRLNVPSGRTPLRSLPANGERLTDLQTCYEAAGRLWVAGVPVERTWPAEPAKSAPPAEPAESPPPAERPRRVPLPGYPYERTRHWIDPAPAEATVVSMVSEPVPASPEPSAQARPGARAAVVEVPVWHQLPQLPAGPPPGRCLVFVADDLGAALASRLRAVGSVVTVVRPGEEFAAGPDGYRIRPMERADYERLLAGYGSGDARIVHAWALAGEPVGNDAAAALAAQRLGYLGLLTLVRALPTVPVDLDVVTADTEDVLGGDLRRPEHATVAGIVQVTPLERPACVVRSVEVTRADTPVEDLVAELCRPDRPPAVALRRGRRWSRRFEAVEPGEPAPAGGVLRDRGRYLITGGLGRFGLALAEDLAVRHRARLVLLSRTTLPLHATDGAGPLAGADPAANAGPAAGAVAAIRRLERAGAEVLHVAADVTDVARLRAVRTEIEVAYGGLDGIVHAARLPDTGVVAASRSAEVVAELAPKLAGALALGEAFGDLPLDFAVLCSSVSAVAGGIGRADDCAANAFLDAYARGPHGWRAPVVSVGWGVWREAGLPGADGLDPGVALAALRRVLAAGLGPHVAIGAHPVADVVDHERWVADQTADGGTAPAVADVPAGDLTGVVTRIWSEVLGVADIGPHDHFFQVGGTSLVAAQLVLRIRQAVGVRLPMRVLFDAPTVARMVERIERLRAAPASGQAEAPIPRLRRPGRPS